MKKWTLLYLTEYDVIVKKTKKTYLTTIIIVDDF